MSLSTTIKSIQDIMRSALLQSDVKLDALLERWAAADREQIALDGRVAEGGMVGERREKLGRDPDPCDLMCPVAFDRPPLTRRARAQGVRQREFYVRFEGVASPLLEELLDAYPDVGVLPEGMALLQNPAPRPAGDGGGARVAVQWQGRVGASGSVV
jgi:type I restriction enzyme R subunit